MGARDVSLVAIAATVILAACDGASSPPDAGAGDIDDGGSPLDRAPIPPEAGPGEIDAGPPLCRSASSELTILIVNDNTGSPLPSQAAFSAALVPFFEALFSGDTDGDGLPDGASLRGAAVGVITTDMGTGSFTGYDCSDANFGDDGVLSSESAGPEHDCAASPLPRWTTVQASDGAASAAEELRCRVTTARDATGCTWEQPLEASLKALTPSTDPTLFFGDTRGHAGEWNLDFADGDGVLAILVVTDEDDCSVADPELFDTATRVYPGSVNLRCTTYPAAVHTIERYVGGLANLRAPGRLVLGVLAGIPPDLVVGPGASFDTVLADARMQQVVDPSTPTQLIPSCNAVGLGRAYPPRRLVEVAARTNGRGHFGAIGSLCQPDLGPTLRAFAATILEAAEAGCR
jgi:hypothetical protein